MNYIDFISDKEQIRSVIEQIEVECGSRITILDACADVSGPKEDVAVKIFECGDVMFARL